MRKLIVVLGLLISLVSCFAEAARGSRFLDGEKISNPTLLAEVMDKSIQANPKGTWAVSPSQCAERGYCTRPVDFLEALQHDDPEAGLKSVSELPGYIRSLKPVYGVKGAYWSDCIVPDKGSSVGWKVMHRCASRPPKPGEAVYYNEKTGKIVMLENCANPIDGPDLSKNCAKIFVHNVGADRAVRFKQYGPADLSLDQDCTALKRPNDEAFTALFLERCESGDCDFSSIDAFLAGLSGHKSGSFDPEVDGVTVVRLPGVVAEDNSPHKMVFCLEYEDGQHSCGVDISWFDYVSVGGEMIAHIYYDESGVERNHVVTRTGKRSNRWWNRDIEHCVE